MSYNKRIFLDMIEIGCESFTQSKRDESIKYLNAYLDKIITIYSKKQVLEKLRNEIYSLIFNESKNIGWKDTNDFWSGYVYGLQNNNEFKSADLIEKWGM